MWCVRRSHPGKHLEIHEDRSGYVPERLSALRAAAEPIEFIQAAGHLQARNIAIRSRPSADPQEARWPHAQELQQRVEELEAMMAKNGIEENSSEEDRNPKPKSNPAASPDSPPVPELTIAYSRSGSLRHQISTSPGHNNRREASRKKNRARGFLRQCLIFPEVIPA